MGSKGWEDDQEIEITILKRIIADLLEILNLPTSILDKINIEIVPKTRGIAGSVNKGRYLILIGRNNSITQLRQQLILLIAKLYLQEHHSPPEIESWVIRLIDQYWATIYRLLQINWEVSRKEE